MLEKKTVCNENIHTRVTCDNDRPSRTDRCLYARRESVSSTRDTRLKHATHVERERNRRLPSTANGTALKNPPREEEERGG
jgi:hypothetical protein